jgi:hypothetical protein
MKSEIDGSLTKIKLKPKTIHFRLHDFHLKRNFGKNKSSNEGLPHVTVLYQIYEKILREVQEMSKVSVFGFDDETKNKLWPTIFKFTSETDITTYFVNEPVKSDIFSKSTFDLYSSCHHQLYPIGSSSALLNNIQEEASAHDAEIVNESYNQVSHRWFYILYGSKGEISDMPYSHRKFFFEHYCRMIRTRVEEWKLSRQGEYSKYKSSTSVNDFIRNTSKKTFGFDKEKNLKFDYGNLDRYFFKYFQPVGGKLTGFGIKLWKFHDWKMSKQGPTTLKDDWL